MKFKFAYDNKTEQLKKVEQIETKTDRLYKAFFIITSAVLNNFIPFTLGYYFLLHRNIIYLIITIILLIFNIKFEYMKDGLIKIKVERNV